MSKGLTSKQKILLQTIKDYRNKNGTSPSLVELQKLLGYSYVNSVVHLLKKLEEKNLITRSSGIERGIKIVNTHKQTFQVPVVGAVACGLPLLAEENLEGYISVDKTLIHGNPHDYFFLRAVGDSMNKADIQGKNIENGDYVLIKQQNSADVNEKVVALIDDEATIKILKRDSGHVILTPQSTNPNNKPIILNSDFSIQGIVKAVFKKKSLMA